MTPEEYVARMQPAAVIAATNTGLPIVLIISQWAHETGWGGSNVAKLANNHAGIKFTSYADYAYDMYSGYDSLTKFAYDYARVIKLSYYNKLREGAAAGASPYELAGMFGPYAEDPDYAVLLRGYLPRVQALLGDVAPVPLPPPPPPPPDEEAPPGIVRENKVAKHVSSQMMNVLSANLQLGDKSPRARLRVFDPRGNHKIYDFDTEDVISIELDRRWDAPAAECTVRLVNTNGMYSPDYNPIKFPQLHMPPSHFQYVFFPNTVFQIFLGYGDNIELMFTGLIDRVNMAVQPDIIEFKGRNMYKKLLTQVLEPPQGKYYYTNWVASDIIADLITKAGLTVEYNTTMITEKGVIKPYVIPGITFEYGQTYSDALGKLLETIYHRIYGTRTGTIKLEQHDFRQPTDQEDFSYDDVMWLKTMQYNVDDSNVRTHIRVVGGGGSDTFRNDYLWQTVCLGERRLASMQAPWWADTTWKRELIAKQIFLQLNRKFRVASFSTIGNPVLDVGDLVKISERISTASAKYQVIGIKSYFSRDQGYYDVVDVEYAAPESNVRHIALNFQKERFEKVMYAQKFRTLALDTRWAATFDIATNPHPFKIVLNQDWGDDITAWSIFVSSNDGPTPQGQQSLAIFDVNIPADGYEYEFQFDYTFACQTNDVFELLIDGVSDGHNVGPKTWRHSQRHKLTPGNHRVIFKFIKNDPENGGGNRTYAYLAIGDVEVYKVTYK